MNKIIYVDGHYEVRDGRNNFVLSGDTWEECYNDMLEIELKDIA